MMEARGLRWFVLTIFSLVPATTPVSLTRELCRPVAPDAAWLSATICPPVNPARSHRRRTADMEFRGRQFHGRR